MPYAQLSDVRLYYEVSGSSGPWVALTPGGRRPLDEFRRLASLIAAEGFRVLLHDRRNCGRSEVVIAGEAPEFEIWADDLKGLLDHLGIGRAIIGGASSGCRLAVVFAIKYPAAVETLLLLRPTGGGFAGKRLSYKYYGEYIDAARAGGMQAVCETEFFAERIAAEPANREKLLATDPEKLIAVFENWSRSFTEQTDSPVIGATIAQLKQLDMPTLILPGNDNTHPRQVAFALAELLPNAELLDVAGPQKDVDVSPQEEIQEFFDLITEAFVSFRRAS